MTAMMLAPGQTLNGRYQILSALAQGGFGATFLATDLHLPDHPRCVVKQLRPQLGEPTALRTARRLFETEAQILHEIGKHNQIPQLFAYFEAQEEFYLVEEYIEGQSFRDELREHGKLSANEVAQVLKEILEILVFVHTNQVIHRDINPSNLIRRRVDGKLCLIDFGAVKRVTTQLAQSAGMGTVAIGTQGYLPSEQAQGRPQFGSDIYAVGMMGIEALTGQFPHLLPSDSLTAEILWRDLVNVDAGLAQVLDKMVRHDFRERFFTAQDALAALTELTQVTSQTVVLGRPEPAPMPPPVTSMPTQMPPLASPTTLFPFRIDPKDRTAMALVIGLGFAGLLSLIISISLGQKWFAGRQATAKDYSQGQLYQESGEAENALRSYQLVLDNNANHQGALLGKAQVQQKLRRYDDALVTYDKLLQVNPNSWEAWLGKGEIYGDRQQYDLAMSALDQAIQNKPDSAEAWGAKAKIYLAQKDTNNALYSLESLLEVDESQTWAWYEKGWIHHNRQQYEEAIGAYDRAVKLDGNDSNVWYQRGNSYFKLGNYSEAQNSYRRTVRLKADHAPAWYSLGISLENSKEYSEAQTAFEKVVQLEPQNDRAWYHVAWNAQKNGNQAAAVAAYQKTTQLKGDDQVSWRALGNLHYEAKNYAQASEAYSRSLTLNAADGDTWERQGNSLLELERYQEAIAAYDQALRYKPDNKQILANKREAEKLINWDQEQVDQEEKEEEEDVGGNIEDAAEELKEKTQEGAEKIKDKAIELKNTVEELLPW
ncbi:MAG: tetratricopeptide repeat protein [Limnothrix sp.]